MIENINKNISYCAAVSADMVALSTMGDNLGDEICAYAAASGNLDVLVWLAERGYVIDENVACVAAHEGHIHIMEWLLEMSHPIPLFAVNAAAIGGKLNIVRWASKFVTIDNSVFGYAIICDNLNILEWGFNENYKFSKDSSIIAAESNNMPMLMWIMNHGGAWHRSITLAAVKNCNVRMFEWAAANGCPFDELQCIEHSKCNHTLIGSIISVNCNVLPSI